MRPLNAIIPFIFPATLLLAACVGSDIEPVGPLPLVVEGWIEEGQPPVVMLTHAVDLTGDVASFDDFVEKWARVSIFDGDTRYILTGRVNNAYTPSFIYTSSRLKGRIGHTYRLLVETETDTLEAFATMLPRPDLVRLEAVRVEDSDSMYSIRAYVDNLRPDGYYKLFSRDFSQDERYYATFTGNFAGYSYNPDEGITVTRGIHSTFEDKDAFSHYYKAGSRVSVKACSLEPEIYEFWRVYDSSVSLSGNLFFTFAENCPSNISGGLGYWVAYGTSQRTIVIPED